MHKLRTLFYVQTEVNFGLKCGTTRMGLYDTPVQHSGHQTIILRGRMSNYTTFVRGALSDWECS